MLKKALHQRLLHLLDPTAALSSIVERLDNLPDVEKLARIYLSSNRLDWLEQTAADMSRKLRTIRDLIDQADDYQVRIEKFREGILPTSDSLPIPGEATLVKELQALERNFHQSIVAPGALAVVTESIVLEEHEMGESVTLGRFKIVLNLQKYTAFEHSEEMYRVFALDPVYPRHDDSFVHPHVADDILCEGAAKHSIRRALDEGRFYDFFHIVNNTLITYNVDSPHVPLRAWLEAGHSCEDCGAHIEEGSDYRCDGCDYIFCSTCITHCARASIDICDQCREAGSSCFRCDDVGGRDCARHENAPCELCHEIPTDAEEVECDAGITFHAECIEDVDELPGCCVGCRLISGCSNLSDDFKPSEEEEEEEEEEDDDDTDTGGGADVDSNEAEGEGGDGGEDGGSEEAGDDENNA